MIVATRMTTLPFMLTSQPSHPDLIIIIWSIMKGWLSLLWFSDLSWCFDSFPVFTFLFSFNSYQSARIRNPAVLASSSSIPSSPTAMTTKSCQLIVFTAKRSSPNVWDPSASGRIVSGLPKNLVTISFILLPFRLISFWFCVPLDIKIFCSNVIQELGGSLSCYSLRDQHRFNPMFYDEGREYTMEDVAKLVQKMRNEWKVSYKHYPMSISYFYNVDSFFRFSVLATSSWITLPTTALGYKSTRRAPTISSIRLTCALLIYSIDSFIIWPSTLEPVNTLIEELILASLLKIKSRYLILLCE